VDATNALFIMTSNIGHEAGLDPADGKARTERLPAEAHKAFRPEFINRLDDIVIFNSLRPEHMKQIARLMLNGLEKRLKARDIGLEVEDAAVEWLCRQGYDQTYGARPLRRVIEQYVENRIAGKLLREEIRPSHVITVDLKEGALVIGLTGTATV
jgi:ATP-dependent Clp protease ATP-binding subunit ClpA